MRLIGSTIFRKNFIKHLRAVFQLYIFRFCNLVHFSIRIPHFSTSLRMIICSNVIMNTILNKEGLKKIVHEMTSSITYNNSWSDKTI